MNFHLDIGAIAELLDDNPEWARDEDVERLHPVTMYPAGWWRRER